MKIKSFFFHYNKPKSKKLGKPIISLHYDKKCHFLENLHIHVNTWGRIRKKQPYFIMTGKCKKVTIENNIGLIQ